MTDFPSIPGYRIERELGRGGMARVYLAHEEKLDRQVALKVLELLSLQGQELAQRFLREARTAAKLQHSNIVSIFDVGQSGNIYYMAVEYLSGGTLRDMLRHGPIDPEMAFQIIVRLSFALDYAHGHGIIHRDVKPENIMFRRDGTPVLMDFGIAKSLDSSTKLTATGTSIGTPYYMSPEQARGHTLDGRSDYYALGIVLYEMLTGRVPYDGPDSVAVIIQHIQDPIPELPPHLARYQRLLERMLVKKRNERVGSGDELLRLIREYGIGTGSFFGVREGTVGDDGVRDQGVRGAERKAPRPSAMPPGWKRSGFSTDKKPKKTTGKPFARSCLIPVLVWALAFAILALIYTMIGELSEGETKRARESEGRLLDKNTGDSRANDLAQKALQEARQRKSEEAEKRQKAEEAERRRKMEEEKQRVIPIPAKTWREPETGMEFVWIPPGEFMMGSNSGDSDEKPVHRVRITKGFWIGKYEVTQGQWQAIMGSNPSNFKKGNNYPVESVSWDDVQEFISRLNSRTGQRFRLPSEAEWEYACRARTTGEMYGDINAVAWYWDNSGRSTQPVGQKQPNAFGLYDMLGNVWEWVQDWYGSDYYGRAPVDDPQGASSGSRRANRGGSWSNLVQDVRAALRFYDAPSYRLFNIGFRLARTE